MKNILQKIAVCLFAFGSINVQAQNFFETVTFAGALSEDPAKDWTTSWTEWDPQNKVYAAVTDSVTINAINNTAAQNIGGTKVLSITSNLVLDASKVYKLEGFVVIAPGSKLTIPAGTVIRGLGSVSNGNYAAIVIRPGAQIFVQGTKSNPVVMTSAKAAGSRATKNVTGKVIGDWGGLVICGNASINPTAPASLEGFSDANVTDLGKYGSNDATKDNDNSGSIRYLRIEFAGLDFATNKELNGLTMGGVGRETEIDYVQASFGGDDAFEWFGGTVNAKHLIAYATADDDFDADFGFRGGVQFGIGVKDSSRFDITWDANSGASTSEGFEIDNDATGTSALPLTAPVFSNMTMMGPIPAGSDYGPMSRIAKGAFRRGARLRRNSAATIMNSIFTGYRNAVMIDGSASLANAGVSANPTYTTTSQFKNNVIWKSNISTSTTNNGFAEVASGADVQVLNDWLFTSTTVGNSKFESSTASGYAKGNLFENAVVGAGFNARPKTALPIASVASFTNSTRFEAVVVSTVAGTGVNTVAGIVINQGELVESSSFLYPNPTEDVTYIQVGSVVSTSASVSIFDISGAEVKKFDTYIVSGTNNILVEGLESGSYIVKLATAKGSVASFKLMKF